MSQLPGRSLAAIEADLRSCCFVRTGAQQELAEVRRRQADLAEIEAVLLVTIESRAYQADRLLDERLQAVAVDDDEVSTPGSDDSGRLTTV